MYLFESKLGYGEFEYSGVSLDSPLEILEFIELS